MNFLAIIAFLLLVAIVYIQNKICKQYDPKELKKISDARSDDVIVEEDSGVIGSIC